MAKVRNQLRRDSALAAIRNGSLASIVCIAPSNYVTRVKMAVCLMLSRAIARCEYELRHRLWGVHDGHRKLWLVRCCTIVKTRVTPT